MKNLFVTEEEVIPPLSRPLRAVPSAVGWRSVIGALILDRIDPAWWPTLLTAEDAIFYLDPDDARLDKFLHVMNVPPTLHFLFLLIQCPTVAVLELLAPTTPPDFPDVLFHCPADLAPWKLQWLLVTQPCPTGQPWRIPQCILRALARSSSQVDVLEHVLQYMDTHHQPISLDTYMLLIEGALHDPSRLLRYLTATVCDCDDTTTEWKKALFAIYADLILNRDDDDIEERVLDLINYVVLYTD